MDTWTMIGIERNSLAEELGGLPDGDWDRPSLCEGWTNREVVAHMTATAFMTPGRFFGRFIGSGFNFNKMVAKDIAEFSVGKSTREMVEAFKSRADARTSPPGPTLSMLGEAIIHGEDIFRPLGAWREHSIDHAVAVLDFFKGSNLIIGAKKRIAGVKLTATDASWSTGEGPEVSGPALALLMAMTGRPIALEDLSGEGVETLRQRM